MAIQQRDTAKLGKCEWRQGEPGRSGVLTLLAPARCFGRQSFCQKAKEAAFPSSPRYHSCWGPALMAVTKGVASTASTGTSTHKEKKSYVSTSNSLHRWVRKPKEHLHDEQFEKVCIWSMISQCPIAAFPHSPSFLKALKTFPEMGCPAPLAACRQQERTSMTLHGRGCKTWCHQREERLMVWRHGWGTLQQHPGHELALARAKAQSLEEFKALMGFWGTWSSSGHLEDAWLKHWVQRTKGTTPFKAGLAKSHSEQPAAKGSQKSHRYVAFQPCRLLSQEGKKGDFPLAAEPPGAPCLSKYPPGTHFHLPLTACSCHEPD